MRSSADDEVSVQLTVFLGAPGSGKGTQAKKLAQHDHFIHLSTGDILRSAIKEGTPLGIEAKKFMDHGELVPDTTMIGLIQETLKNLAPHQHVILDGFPRTVAQAEALEAQSTTKIRSAILFEIADDLLIERLTGRRVCKHCGQPFHVRHMRPQQDGKCDACGSEVVQRSDDTESVVKRRLEVFHSQNKGLVDFYSKQGSLQRVNANQAPEKIQSLLMELLT